MRKFVWVWIIVAFMLIAGFAYWKYSYPLSQGDLLNYVMKEHTNLALHIHTTLQIEILGENYTLPENIGVSEYGMRVIHTHKEPNILHIESPYAHQFYLRDFFKIFGRIFNETCIFDSCVNSKNELRLYVNGVETHQFENTPLYDGQTIEIVYTEKKIKSLS